MGRTIQGHRAFYLALAGLVLAFALSWYLRDPWPFTVVGGAAVGGKYAENVQERRRQSKRKEGP